MWRYLVKSMFKLRRFSTYLSKIRYLLIAPIFHRAGKGGSVGKRFRVLGDLLITLGDRVAFRDDIYLGGDGELIIGSHTAINAGCMITAMEKVEIGSNVMLAPNVCVLDVDHSFQRRDIPIAQQGYRIKPVVIEDDVWIGTGAVITKGVRIGKGAIIGANSVVTRDIPSFAIAVGIPARVIKGRPE